MVWKPKKVGRKAKTVTFSVDCKKPVDVMIMDVAAVEKYLHERVKVDGKRGNLGDSVKISRDKAVVTVTAQEPFSQRPIRYLTRRHLKRANLRDWLRVVSNCKTSYELRYYSIADHEEEDDGDEEE
ncbi:hypothetical protein MMPV_002565 [Pyropia vietnamensis]